MSRYEVVYADTRSAILAGEFEPSQAVSPQELANRFGVSLAVARESLLRLVGEGLVERITNRGFFLPSADSDRWQQIAEARAIIEPQALRLAIARGDVVWEANVRASHHTLSRAVAGSDAWHIAHHDFHRALLAGCDNLVLLDAFERLWDASQLTRVWSASVGPIRDHAAEHAALEHACLDRDAPLAAELLTAHLGATAAGLRTW
jgi:DNA-binding GntR family transcriptional regulator